MDDGETPVVMDLGTGAFANLRRYADYDRLGAVVISHMHADHFIDVIPLRYADPRGHLELLSTVSMFVTAEDITLAELSIEAFYPASAATAELLRGR